MLRANSAALFRLENKVMKREYTDMPDSAALPGAVIRQYTAMYKEYVNQTIEFCLKGSVSRDFLPPFFS